MTTQEIKKLLDQYFEGETSLQEEDQLKRYFRQSDIDPELKPFQALFQYFKAEEQVSLSDDFEAQLLEKIREEKRPVLRRIRPYIFRVAAAAAVITGIVLFYPNQPQPAEAMAINWEAYEPQTEEEAMAQTAAALEILAAKLNGSAKTASNQLGKIEKTSNVFK
jgi:hypothetical protein